MRVLVWPAGDFNDPVAQYRMFMPAVALAAQGADVVIDKVGPSCIWDREWHGDSPPWDAQLMGLAETPEADIVVMQRPVRRWWVELIPLFQERGVRVCVDVDDNFQHLAPGHVGHNFFDPRMRSHINQEHVAWACRQADLVTCTTPALLEKYGYGHGAIIPNLVPENYLFAFGTGPQSIGWPGSVGTHPDDLQVTGGAVQDALSASGWEFWNVGTGINVAENLGITQPIFYSGYVPFERYISEVARMKVGIVPLNDTVFNHAKSCLKMMEMAACGIPVVASPTPDNVRLQKMGVGVTATTPQKWRKHLMALVRSAQYRADLGGAGKEVMKGLTYEQHCGRWWDAWQGAVEKRSSLILPSLMTLNRLEGARR